MDLVEGQGRLERDGDLSGSAGLYGVAAGPVPGGNPLEVIAQHTRSDGSTAAPMRIAHTCVNVGIVAARRGDLDGAVTCGESAFEFARMSVIDLLARTGELDRTIQQRYRGERLAP